MTGPASTTRSAADREAADLAYIPGRSIPSVEPFLLEYARRSERARALLAWRDLACGSDPAQRLHFFPAPRPNADLFVFVHGGYWQELSEEQSSFAAPDVVASGAAFAALGYGLAPRHRLGGIVAMVRESLRWLREHADELGFDRRRVILVGHSAGAHLAAMCLVEDPGAACAAVLLSGLYDLEPLLATSVGAQIGLTGEEAVRNSPARLLRPGLPPLLLARGADEPGGFGDQQRRMADAAKRMHVPVDDLVVSRRNHFDLPLGFADPADPLGAAVTAFLRRRVTSWRGPCATC